MLCQDRFKGLKAILDSVSHDRGAVCEGVEGAKSYEELLGRLGYRVAVTKQIHVADSYSRTGPAGGSGRCCLISTFRRRARCPHS